MRRQSEQRAFLERLRIQKNRNENYELWVIKFLYVSLTFIANFRYAKSVEHFDQNCEVSVVSQNFDLRVAKLQIFWTENSIDDVDDAVTSLQNFNDQSSVDCYNLQ